MGRNTAADKNPHPYKLYLPLNDLEHTCIRLERPHFNGSVERLNQTIKDEFYSVTFRKKLYRISWISMQTLMTSWCITQPEHEPGFGTVRAVHRSKPLMTGLNYISNMHIMLSRK
jgi:hypothetical protein